MANLVGEPFNQYVSNQIIERQKIQGKKTSRTPEEIIYLNSRNSWVKLASSVSLDANRIDLLVANGNPMVTEDDGGTALARRNILFNGLSQLGGTGSDAEERGPNIYDNQPLEQRARVRDLPGGGVNNISKKAYGVGGNDFGYSPMPGITDISIKDLNRGSLKQADITIIANNRNQFEIIDVLYMRLGMSVLLEWGYDKYIDNNGELQNMGTTLIEDDWFETGLNRTYQTWLPEIENKRQETSGNYDGLFGTITNFSWTFEQDGSYKIKLKLMSLGDVIESLKVNLPATSIKLDPNSQAQKLNRAVTFTEEAQNITQFFELYPALKEKIKLVHGALRNASNAGNELLVPITSFFTAVNNRFRAARDMGIPEIPLQRIGGVPLIVPFHAQRSHITNDNFLKLLEYPTNQTDAKAKENVDAHLWDAMLFAMHALVEGKVGGDTYFGSQYDATVSTDLDQVPWLKPFQNEEYISQAYNTLQATNKIKTHPFKDVKTTAGNTIFVTGYNIKPGEILFKKNSTIDFEDPNLLMKKTVVIGFGSKKGQTRTNIRWEKFPTLNRKKALAYIIWDSIRSLYADNRFNYKSNLSQKFVWEPWAAQSNEWEEVNKNFYKLPTGFTGKNATRVGNEITSIIFNNIPLESFEQEIFEYFKKVGAAGGEEDPQFQNESESEEIEVAIEANQDKNRIYKYFYKIREYYKNVRDGSFNKAEIGTIKIPAPKGVKKRIGYVINPLKGSKLDEWNRQPILYPKYDRNSDSRDIIQLSIEPVKYAYFIRLGTFLEFLQDRVIPYIQNGKNQSSLINIDTKKDGNICYYIDNVISNDIRKCIVANYDFYNGTKSGARSKRFDKIFENLEYYKGPKSDYAYGRIMNIYFNFDRLEEIFDKKDKKGEVNLFEVCKTICDDINECLGNVNNIEPVINKLTNTITFIDQTPIPNLDKIALQLEDYKNRATTEATLEVLGYNNDDEKDTSTSNFVRKVGITTKIDKNYATMITIGATANGSIPGMEATAFSKWNIGITDRFKQNIVDASIDENNLEKQNADILANYNLFIQSTTETQALQRLGLNVSLKISEPYITNNKSTISNYYNYAQAKTSLDKGGFESSVGFLPFDLKLSLDGISGMKIYNRVKVNSAFLPSNYPETLKFIVTGVSHKINNSDWTTDIDTLATSNLQQDQTVEIIDTPDLLGAAPSPPAQPSAPPSPSPTVETTEEDGKLPNRTRPNKYPFTWKNYGSRSRGGRGNLDNPKVRDVSKITGIFLHHTATAQIADKGKEVVDGWNGAWASANVVIDANGHREYMIESKYIANTQGNHIEPTRTSYNDTGVAVEMQCDGFYSQIREDIPGHIGKKMYGRKGFRNNRYVDESKISAPYDFNLKNIGKFKGQQYLQEYTPAQLTSLAEWIKEKINEIGGDMLNWRFNEHTYKQMFPNKYKKGLTSTPVIEDGILFRDYWVKRDKKWVRKTRGWGISPDAYNFVPGVYTHSSIVATKTDLCPTKGIVTMLKQNFGEQVSSLSTTTPKHKGKQKKGKFFQGTPPVSEAIDGEFYQNTKTGEKYKFTGGRYIKLPLQ